MRCLLQPRGVERAKSIGMPLIETCQSHIRRLFIARAEDRRRLWRPGVGSRRRCAELVHQNLACVDARLRIRQPSRGIGQCIEEIGIVRIVKLDAVYVRIASQKASADGS